MRGNYLACGATQGIPIGYSEWPTLLNSAGVKGKEQHYWVAHTVEFSEGDEYEEQGATIPHESASRVNSNKTAWVGVKGKQQQNRLSRCEG